MDVGHARSVLGVEPGAPPDRVNAAFRRKARSLHPDGGGDPAQFRAAFEAREVLLGATAAQPSSAAPGATNVRFAQTPTRHEALRALLVRLVLAMAKTARRRR